MADSNDTQNEPEPGINKPVMFLGKDLRKITCFRDSFIFGICGGALGGLGCFLYTSKVTFSTHFAFFSLWVCVWGYWVPCRYKYETNLLKVEKWKKMAEGKNSAAS